MQLSAKGRQEFGTWLANRLVIACGGASALILIPAITGKLVIPDNAMVGGVAVVVVLAAIAGLIKFYTAERVGEALSAESSDD